MVATVIEQFHFECTTQEDINMKISNRMLILAIGAMVSLSVVAASQEDGAATPEMPMMNQGMGNMMMNPQMMQQMMNPQMMNPQMMQQMMTPEQMQNMRLMHQQAMQQMMPQMPQMGYGPGYGMPMMPQGMGNMMMNPQMMQMMQMRMQHMERMEQHMAKIESLLEKILEAQKSE